MPGLDWGTILIQYARAIGWSITAAVGFAFGIGIALKVFDMLSTDIDEWEEIKIELRVINQKQQYRTLKVKKCSIVNRCD